MIQVDSALYNLSIVQTSMAAVVSMLAVDHNFESSGPSAEFFLGLSLGSVMVRASLVISDVLNKFHLRYTAVILESRDWRFPSNRDLEAPHGPLVTA